MPTLLVVLSWAGALAQPTITKEPADASVSPGGLAQFTVLANSTSPPTTWQWWFQNAALDPVANPSAARNKLLLTNVALADAGPYFVVVSDAEGSVTSRVATLTVDTTFTVITTGPPVTDLGCCWGPGTWGDYDGDGYPDLFVPRYNTGRSALYRNNRDGTFTSIPDPPASQVGTWASGAFADFNNDGRLDLFAYRYGATGSFYFNNGDGTFASTQSPSASPWNVCVVDFNHDGRLDVFLTAMSGLNTLLRNDGGGTFTRMTQAQVGSLVTTGGAGSMWADYDDDGYVDMYVATYFSTKRNLLFRNDGTGRMLPATNTVTRSAAPNALTGAWGDYDNDGRLDLLVANFSGSSVLYHNVGNGEFEVASVGTTIGSCNSATWADYDNDGFIDLFLTYPNQLYHNNGDGTFTRITTGSLVTDVAVGGGVSMGGLWFDYDNDGFLDLYVTNGNDAGTANTRNFLYHNNGNGNAWLKIKLVGTTSNRDGAGAKVRIQATFAGQVRWLRRDISAGDGYNGNQLLAHFGLGDATNVDVVRIEWPSGNVDELTNVAPNQLLTVTEKIWITPQRPSASVNGSVKLYPTALGPFFQWQFQGTDLPGMTNAVLSLTNLTADQQGRYSVVAGDGTAAVTNYTYLIVDPQFFKVTEGPVATDKVSSWSGHFGDYDGDGLLDLVVEGDYFSVGRNTRLYHNEGQGQFSPVLSGPWENLRDRVLQCAWADPDNDGDLDLLLAGYEYDLPFYLRNDGGGAFTRLPVDKTWTTNKLQIRGGSCAWADFDNDGWLDAVLNGSSTYLLRNNGDGTFTVPTKSPVSSYWPQGIQWIDYDNDGDQDLFMPDESAAAHLFRNDGQGQFKDVSATVLQGRVGGGAGGAWGDFDNDGDLDLYFVLANGGSVFLVNNGDGTFSNWKGNPAILLKAGGNWGLPAWGDYDNDGWLDLFTVMPGRLFRNLGDGNLAEVTTGSPVKDTAMAKSAVWADYDNNGALDLLVTRAPNLGNLLYQNNGNGNHWLKVRPKGTASNSHAIGARVIAQANINGKPVRQRRDISAGSVIQELEAHFGLGNRTVVTHLRIEWPSGAVQEFSNVPADQILTVWEPPVLRAAMAPDGACVLSLRAEPNRAWQIQASSDLVTWETLTSVTPTAVAFEYTDPAVAGMSCRFYRVKGE